MFNRSQHAAPSGVVLAHTAAESRLSGWAYEAMDHTPDHAFVILSYSVFAREILRQWEQLKEGGLTFVPSSDDPYGSSANMLESVYMRQEVTIWTNGGTHLPDDHPMKAPVESGVEGFAVLNDVFRGVHDVLGHAASGGEFGPKGEEVAWRKHKSMLSPITHLALWCETIGQNKWTNFTFDHQAMELRDRPFPEQKSGLVPILLR